MLQETTLPNLPSLWYGDIPPGNQYLSCRPLDQKTAEIFTKGLKFIDAKPGCQLFAVEEKGQRIILDEADVLGKGSTSRVLVGQLIKGGQTIPIAVKIFDQELALDNWECSPEQFTWGAGVLSLLEHPYIAKTYGLTVVVDPWSNREMPAVVMERGIGSVYDLAKTKTFDPQREVPIMTMQIGEALDYCHQHYLGFVDVGSKNILQRSNGDYFLTDTETVVLERSNKIPMATWSFAAPEAIKLHLVKASGIKGEYGWEDFCYADQHALAAIVYSLLSRQDYVNDKFYQSITGSFGSEHKTTDTFLARNRFVNEQVYQVLLKATSFSPEDRYTSCSDFALALTEAMFS